MTVTARPVRVATAGMARASAAMEVPNRSTVGTGLLPDTTPDISRRPGVQDLPSSAWVLCKVKRDEQRLGQRPGLAVHDHSTGADQRDRVDPNVRGPSAAVAGGS